MSYLLKSTKNSSFGTAFCIKQDTKGSYFVTCTHVVEDCGIDSLVCDLECDFVVEKNREIVELIQVTVTLQNEKTRKRELAPFSKVTDELNLKDVKMTVLCEDSSEVLDSGVEVVNVLEWLVMG